MLKNKLSIKLISLVILFSFFANTVLPAPLLAATLNLPKPTQFVTLSNAYSFPALKGLKFDPSNPLQMEFIIDTADQKKVSEDEAARLIRYFLAGLTIPGDQLWVNMSPYEKERIISPALASTDLGEDLLSQDYILKQLSASLTHPESQTGKDFWLKTYEAMANIANGAKSPVNTFNKVWIMPGESEVYENSNFALVAKANLKTMLDEDYLALKENGKKMNNVSSQIMRQVILPKINQEVNSGKNFTTVRQIYHSLILAVWFKKKFQESIYSSYIGKGKVKGIDLAQKDAKEKIYNLYVEAFKKGVYNYIKTDTEPVTKRHIKRQYFSGGENFTSSAITETQSYNNFPNDIAKQNVLLKNSGIDSNDTVINIVSSPIQQNISVADLLKTAVARPVFDSRGFPTVETEVTLPDGKVIRVIVPSGASTGEAEALELRDGGKDYKGKGVTKAVNNAQNIIIPKLIEALNNKEFTIFEQEKIDAFLNKLDGDPKGLKSNLGANAVLAVSLLAARIGAYYSGHGDNEFYKYIHKLFGEKAPRIPLAMMNVLNGGKHAPDGPDIQEFMIGAVSAKSMQEQMKITTEVFHTYGDLLKNDKKSLIKKYGQEAYDKYNLSRVLGRQITGSLGSAFGDEGGFVPEFVNNREPFLAITAAIRLAGYNQNGKIDVALGMDGALSEWDKGPLGERGHYRIYHFRKPVVLSNGTTLGKQLEDGVWEVTSLDLISFYQDLIQDTDNIAYLFSIEDGLGEKDWLGAGEGASGWEALSVKVGSEFARNLPFYSQLSKLLKENYDVTLNGIQVVADDPTATNPALTRKAINYRTANALLDKLNQIGTLTEAAQAGNLALDNLWNLMVSHRSGETEDVAIAHFSVGMGGGFIKTGAPNRTDRNAKYNELLRIEEKLLAAASPIETFVGALNKSYNAGVTDENVKPVVLTDDTGNPMGRVKKGDAWISFNFRRDRTDQITGALLEGKNFKPFSAQDLDLMVVEMKEDENGLVPLDQVVLQPVHIPETAGEYLSKLGLKQFRTGETEKFRHVTRFFNGAYSTKPFEGEDRDLVGSPKDVVTYDQKPEMSADKITDGLVEKLTANQHNVYVVNYANPDMVGHTGNLDATVQAIGAVDKNLARVLDAAYTKGINVLITADHGNAEAMLEKGKPQTKHSTNPVPLIFVPSASAIVNGTVSLKSGGLADVAPTLLHTMGLSAPVEMTGKNLLEGYTFTSGQRTLLIILDGFGINPDKKDPGDAIRKASEKGLTPTLDKLFRENLNTTLEASGEAVGLPNGQMGSSETGHLTLGAGRVIEDQPLVKINAMIKSGDFFNNSALLKAIAYARDNKKTLHLEGLLSDGGVHSMNTHLYALLKMAKSAGLREVYIHANLDGRDVGPKTAEKYLRELQAKIDEIGVGRIVTITGRTYSMDRDNKWDRTKIAYDAYVNGAGERVASSSAVNPADINGGIDFNKIDVNASSASVPLNMPMLNFENMEGLTFKIIRMESIANFPSFFRVSAKDEKQEEPQRLAYLRN